MAILTELEREEVRAYLKENSIWVPFCGCWLWLRTIAKEGYGLSFKFGVETTHRLAYRVFKGEIPERMCVCHRCDTKPCINPDHLWLGTNTDNVRDRDLKNHTARGEKHWKAKLTETDVKEIIRLHLEGLSQTTIAKRFTVSKVQIHYIVRGRYWKYLS